MFIAQVTSYFYCTSYKLLFISRVTSYCLLHKLRVTFHVQVMSCFLTMSYNKDKDNKAVYDNNVMIKIFA